MDSLVQQLEACVKNGKIDEGKALLNQVKVALLSSQLNPTDTAKAVAALELGVVLAVQAEDLDAFGRTVALIQPYYYYHDEPYKQTPRKLLVTGLYLMLLLVRNRLSEFHSELELLTEQEASSPFISFPVGLETTVDGGHLRRNSGGATSRCLVPALSRSHRPNGARLDCRLHGSFLQEPELAAGGGDYETGYDTGTVGVRTRGARRLDS